MSVDFEDESKKSEAVDGEPQDVPGLVRMSKHAVETSMSQHATLSADDAAKVPTESESEVAAEVHQQHHLTREQLAKAREQLEQQLNTETVVGGKSKLPLIVGLLFVAAAGGAYLFLSSDTAPSDVGEKSVGISNPPVTSDAPGTEVAVTSLPSDAAGEVTAETAAADENTGERVEHTTVDRVGGAEIYRQQKEELLEAQEEERERLAAELEVKRKTGEARLAAELQVKRKSEQARLIAELEAAKRAEQQRMQAELEATKRKEKARLDAELKAAKRAEQRRIQAELAATKKAEEARLAAELEVAIRVEQARFAAEVAESQAVVAETPELTEQDDAKFSANPCDGPTAKFLSTCR